MLYLGVIHINEEGESTDLTIRNRSILWLSPVIAYLYAGLDINLITTAVGEA